MRAVITSIVVEMDNVVIPQKKSSQIHLFFRGNRIGERVYAGQFTENDDGKVFHSTWYGVVPSLKDQALYSNAMDKGAADSTEQELQVEQFNANLMRNAMNGIINNANKISPMPSYPGAPPGF